MSTTADRFRTLVTNLRTTNDATVRNRCAAITRRLNSDFWGTDSSTYHSRFVGSYGRGTQIRGASDIDYLFVLPYAIYDQYNRYLGNGQSALLQAVRNSIRNTYPTTDIGGDGQVVVVQFSDNMHFDVLPAFINDDGISYTYPDSRGGGQWRRTNPVPELHAIDEANKLYGGKAKHLGRMARAWADRNDVPISGWLIDTLVYDFMPGWQYNDKSFVYYDYMTRDFLLYLSTRDRSQMYWIAPGSGQHVPRKGVFEAKAKTGYDNACWAVHYESNENLYSATQYWKTIFGGFFTG